MNENDFKNETSKVDTYRATTNLNVDIENPQINMNSAVGINIKNVEPNDHANDRFSNDNNLGNDFYTFSNEVDNFKGGYGFTSNVDNMVSEKFDSDLKHSDSQFVPINSVSNENPMNDRVIYEPTLKEKKRSNQGFSIPREIKITFFIIFILLVFILVLPYIYDFFKNLQLALTR